MNVFIAVLWMEFRNQTRQPVVWGTFIVVSGLLLWEVLPNAANLARLSGLTDPAYAAARLMLFSTPLFALMAVLLSSDRVHHQFSHGQDTLLWTTPGMTPWVYLFGRYLGNVLAFGLLPLALSCLGLMMRLVWLPEGFAYLPFLTAALLLGLLPVAYSIALGLLLRVLVGPRAASAALILYILWSMFFAPVDGDGASPVFRLGGDLYSLIYTVPGYPANAALQSSGWNTLLFEGAVLALCLLLLAGALQTVQKNRFSRL
jgi:hypothetical protein